MNRHEADSTDEAIHTGVAVGDGDHLVVTFRVQGAPSLAKAAHDVLIEESTGTDRVGHELFARVGGHVVNVTVEGIAPICLPSAPLSRAGIERGEVGLVQVSWPVENVSTLPALLGVVAGETFETGAFGMFRLVHLDLPAALVTTIAGPAFGVDGIREFLRVADRPIVGAIVKPSTGLDPAEFAEAAAHLGRGGADFVKDDEILTDPPHCRFVERVAKTRAALDLVEGELGRRILYAPNVTGPIDSLAERISFAARHECGLVMINGWVMGFDTIRHAAAIAGVPLFVHRVFSGAFTRSESIGIAPTVLAGLTRLAGADFVQVGGIAGKIFESDDVVVKNSEACLAPLGGIRTAMPVIGGGQSDETVDPIRAMYQHRDFVHLLGSAALGDPDGPTAGVAKAVDAWEGDRLD